MKFALVLFASALFFWVAQAQSIKSNYDPNMNVPTGNLSNDGGPQKKDASFQREETTLILRNYQGDILGMVTTESLHSCLNAAQYTVSASRSQNYSGGWGSGKNTTTEAACINTNTMQIVNGTRVGETGND